MIQIITDPGKIDRKAWSEFVFNHPQGNIFQTPEMYDVYLKTKNYSPIVFFAIDNNQLFGVLLALVQKEYKGFLGKFSSRCILWGAPLISNNDAFVFSLLIKDFDSKIKKLAIYTQFRNIDNIAHFHHLFSASHFDYEPHLDILINTVNPFESITKSIHKSRFRNYKKSLNKGATFQLIAKYDEITKCYDLLRETYQRVKLPYPDFTLFKAVYEILLPKKYCLIFGLYYQDFLIGFRLVLTYKNRMYDYYAGSSAEHTNKYPNDVLIIEILKYACITNFDIFDFGGAGKPGLPYGVRDHKLKFGGELVEFGRYEKINKTVSYSIAKTAFSIWKFLK
jgi:serine/alanine adding enzyme